MKEELSVAIDRLRGISALMLGHCVLLESERDADTYAMDILKSAVNGVIVDLEKVFAYYEAKDAKELQAYVDSRVGL